MSDTPEWFWQAVDQAPESHSIEVAGDDIHYLTWGEKKPRGILFVHGHNAHAHWWDFIAPSFTDEFQVVAIDLSGMGDSDHRDEYSNLTYEKEILAVANDAGLPEDTILVAHSYGGMMSIYATASMQSRGENRFSHLVLLDSGVRHPDDIKERDPKIERLSRPKVYPQRDIAISRFRLQPPQTCVNQYLVDHIARHSVEFDDEEDGWLWKFDAELDARTTIEGDLEAAFKAITGPVTLIYGQNSESFKSRSAEYMKSMKPELQVIELADAQHHLFLDQPLAFIETLKSVLS